MFPEKVGSFPVFRSVPEMFQIRSRENAPNPTIFRKEAGAWRALTAGEVARRVKAWTLGLLSLGIKKGDKVAVLSGTRREWMDADLATLHAGAVTVGVYPTLNEQDVRYQLSHSEARIVFVEDQEQLDKVLAVKKDCPRLERAIAFEGNVTVDRDFSISVEDLEARGEVFQREHPAAFDASWQAVGRDDMATLVYTSGTTGPPKGAILTHGNFCFVVAAATQAIPSRGNQDLGVAFLPLAHVLQRFAGYLGLYSGIRGAYAEAVDKLIDNFRELRPTVQVSVPRIWERMHARIEAGLPTAPAWRRALFHWAHDVGKRSAPWRKRNEPVPGLLGLQWKMARAFWRKVVLKKLGFERVRFLSSGGAPISPALLEFFFAMDILILEGWGLTETAAPVTCNRPEDFRFGTVGRLIEGTELKVAEDGELCVRGPGVFKGYFKDEDATRDAFDEHGFFRTGDIGTMDEGGWVRITDRKKNLIVLSTGKKVAPQNLENLFKAAPILGPCLIHGDRRKFLTAVFTLDPDEAKSWAKERGLADDPSALAKNAEVEKLVGEVVERTNAQLSDFEKVKRWAVTGDRWTVDNGALTPTLKVKRKVLEERYRSLLESFYEGQNA